MQRGKFRKPEFISDGFNKKPWFGMPNKHAFCPGVLFAYFFIVAIITFPLIFKINHYILGSFGGYQDLSWELWLHWFVKDSLANFRPLYFTDIAHYPVGVNVLIDSVNFLNPVLSSLLQVFFNLTTSYNILCLLLLTLNAFGAYLLMRYLFKDKAIAFISGIIYAFNPYIITEISSGRLAQASAGWIPLYLLFLFKTLRENKARDPILAVIFLVLTSLSSWYYGAFSIIFTMLYVIYLVFSRNFNASSFRRTSMLFLLFAIIILPFVYPFIRAGGTGNISGLFGRVYSGSFDSITRNSLEPNFPFHNLYYISGVFKRISPIVIMLSFLPLLFIKKKPKFWIFSSLFFYILCLGPYLKIGEKIHLIHGKMFPLPYLLFYKFFPFFWKFRWPDRFIAMLMLSLAVLSGNNLLWILKTFKIAKLKKFILSGILACLLILEIPLLPLVYQFPVPLSKAEVPYFYHKLAQEEDCAIIQYPFFSGSYPGAIMYGYYQTVHRKKMLAGPSSLTKLYQPGQLEFINNNTFIQFLLNLQESSAFPSEFKKGDIEALERTGFKYLIVNTGFLGPELSNVVISKLNHIFDNPDVYPEGIMVYHL